MLLLCQLVIWKSRHTIPQVERAGMKTVAFFL
jgi:hypothetical protein